MIDWIRREIARGLLPGWPILVGASVAVAVVSFVVGVVVVVKLPEDFFVRVPGPRPASAGQRGIRLAVAFFKNLLGIFVFLAGFLMALPLVPGPGLLFMLVGLSLVDFPGKRPLERRLLRERHVLRSVNRMRARFGKPALRTDKRQGQSMVDSDA